jgi:Probable cobalt transporter subunit (CbtA)
MLGFIGRGGLAGACAGVLSGLFSLLFAEATLDRAIALEHNDGAGVFTRDVQYFGLLVTSVLAGVAFGIIFGVVYAVRHRHDPGADPWGRALRLAIAGLLGVSLLPFLRYPANPPGAGDPGTVDVRTTWWLAAIVIGIATMAAADQVRKRLAAVSTPMRDLATAGVVVVGLVVILLLPATPPSDGVPAELLWSFRLYSVAATGILWLCLGVGFGIAGWRAAQAASRETTTTMTAS